MAVSTKDFTRLPSNVGVREAVQTCLSVLRVAVDKPMWQLSDEELTASVVEVSALICGAEELLSREVAAADERKLASHECMPSTTAWLSFHTDVSKPAAAKIVHGARDVGASSLLRNAWALGRISTEKVLICAVGIAKLPDDLPVATVESAQIQLLDVATRFNCKDLRWVANRILQWMDPEGADAKLGQQLADQEKKAFRNASFYTRRVGDGSTRVVARIPDLQADMLSAIIDGLASPKRDKPGPNHDADGHGCGEEFGPIGIEQRRGWAFMELIEKLPKSVYPQHGGIEATIVVNIDYDQLLKTVGTALLSSGTQISAGEARRLACNARILPAVLNGPSRILDHGLDKRLFDRAQRLYIAQRDQGCCWRGCDRAASQCEYHHLTEYADGGPTNVANGSIFCWFHHQLLTNSDWHARLADDNIVEVIPPTRIDPRRQPMRHQRHQLRAELQPA